MGLFGSKKKTNYGQKLDLPPLKFPDLPSDSSQEKVSAETNEIKQAVAPPVPESFERPVERPMPVEAVEEDKPIFIRVEKYKDVLETLNELKGKLKDASDILRELNRIKDEEDRELSAWSEDLETLKDKLMAIDQTLFETE